MFAELGGSGIVGQGHNGASGINSGASCSGGGGGAGAPGGNGATGSCNGGDGMSMCNGGDGKQSNITGSLVWYAG